jgi:hypothetical protein
LHGIALEKLVTKPCVLHVALVEEDFLAVFSDDESKTLRGIVEFDGTSLH